MNGRKRVGSSSVEILSLYDGVISPFLSLVVKPILPGRGENARIEADITSLVSFVGAHWRRLVPNHCGVGVEVLLRTLHLVKLESFVRLLLALNVCHIEKLSRVLRRCNPQHLAEAFAVAGDVVTLLPELGEPSVKDQFLGHLLSEELWTLSHSPQNFLIRLEVPVLLLADEPLAPNFLVENFLELIYLRSELPDRVGQGVVSG